MQIVSRFCEYARSVSNFFLIFAPIDKPKKMNRILTTLAVLAVVLCTQAQTTFHDRELNDVKGPVKSITIMHWNKPVVTNFSPEGKMQCDAMGEPTYDENGYMISIVSQLKGAKGTVTTFKWENGRVVSQTDTTKKGKTLTTTHYFDDRGLIVKDVIVKGNQTVEYDYYDYELDSHGNWISRSFKLMGMEAKHPRTIEYYE